MSQSQERSRSRALLGAGIVFFLVGLVITAWNIYLPLLAYSPGPITDATDSIIVEGAPSYLAEGELMVLTAASQDINVFEALIAATDPTVDVIGRQAVRRPDESDEDYRRRMLVLMDNSTARAITIALTRVDLGDRPLHPFIVGYAADTAAGEVLEIGDRIVSLDGESVEELDDLGAALSDRRPGDVVSIEVERDGEVLQYDVDLVTDQDEGDGEERAVIGIIVRSLPFWIEIDSGIVGGPSAGMMYTLAIIDALTPEDLTKGRIIAGTGTINEDGTIGNVGAVRQKVPAAEAAGAEYMLVPAGNHETALTAPRTDLELVPVATIDEALEFLGTLPDA